MKGINKPQSPQHLHDVVFAPLARFRAKTAENGENALIVEKNGKKERITR